MPNLIAAVVGVLLLCTAVGRIMLSPKTWTDHFWPFMCKLMFAAVLIGVAWVLVVNYLLNR